ncbi:chymotrypsin inhibitor-like protein [Aphelenchoides avenae]|nr:chymotrypsin inhibitor-like protein [Aphelenchus avenae]
MKPYLRVAQSCGAGETWRTCGGCEGTCEDPYPICKLDCGPARCECDENTVRDHNKQCVQVRECFKKEAGFVPNAQGMYNLDINMPALPHLWVLRACAKQGCDASSCKMVGGKPACAPA